MGVVLLKVATCHTLNLYEFAQLADAIRPMHRILSTFAFRRTRWTDSALFGVFRHSTISRVILYDRDKSMLVWPPIGVWGNDREGVFGD
jgi:hypothetical protein